jgi:hypothetical protein
MNTNERKLKAEANLPSLCGPFTLIRFYSGPFVVVPRLHL